MLWGTFFHSMRQNGTNFYMLVSDSGQFLETVNLPPPGLSVVRIHQLALTQNFEEWWCETVPIRKWLKRLPERGSEFMGSNPIGDWSNIEQIRPHTQFVLTKLQRVNRWLKILGSHSVTVHPPVLKKTKSTGGVILLICCKHSWFPPARLKRWMWRPPAMLRKTHCDLEQHFFRTRGSTG